MNHIVDGGQSSLTQDASTGELAPLSSGMRRWRRGPHADRRVCGALVLEETVIKLCCKPVGSLISSLYGTLAGAIVHRIWVSIERHDDSLQASRAQRSWQQAALVAFFQHVIFGVVKATVFGDRVFPVIGPARRGLSGRRRPAAGKAARS